jgi:hypothetical protein
LVLLSAGFLVNLQHSPSAFSTSAEERGTLFPMSLLAEVARYGKHKQVRNLLVTGYMAQKRELNIRFVPCQPLDRRFRFALVAPRA